MASENEHEKRESLADIVSEIRRAVEYMGDDLPYTVSAGAMRRIASRIEAAWTRERDEIEAQALSIGGIVPGNAAAMREAMEMARDALKSAEKYVYGDPPNGGAIGWDDVWPSEWHNALEAVERALSAPPRQCDVGTAEEQTERMWNEYCRKYECLVYDHGVERHCPLYHARGIDCRLIWAQMPYEEGGAE